MKKEYFVFQLKQFLLNPKNIGLYVLSAVLALYFGIVSVPNRQVIENVDIYSIKKEYKDDKAFLKVAQKEVKRANTGNRYFNPSQGAIDAIKTYPTIIKYDAQRIKALKNNNWNLYTSSTSNWYKKMDNLIFVQENQNYFYPVQYYQNGNYREDGHFGYQRTRYFYSGLLTAKASINKNVLEEKTFLQVLGVSLSGWTTLLLIVIIIFFSADIITRDSKNKTVLKNIPLSKNTIVWLKTAVVEIGIFMNFSLMFLITLICIAPKTGLGNLNLTTTFYMGRLYFKVPFMWITLGKYWLEFLIFAILITFIFIRLTILLSILINNEFVAGILASAIAVSGKVFYFYLGMGYVYPFLKKLPMTYFTIGESLTGNLSYLMDSPGWGFDDGLIPLLSMLIVIELAIFIINRNKSISLIRG